MRHTSVFDSSDPLKKLKSFSAFSVLFPSLYSIFIVVRLYLNLVCLISIKSLYLCSVNRSVGSGTVSVGISTSVSKIVFTTSQPVPFKGAGKSFWGVPICGMALYIDENCKPMSCFASVAACIFEFS